MPPPPEHPAPDAVRASLIQPGLLALVSAERLCVWQT